MFSTFVCSVPIWVRGICPGRRSGCVCSCALPRTAGSESAAVYEVLPMRPGVHQAPAETQSRDTLRDRGTAVTSCDRAACHCSYFYRQF